MRFSPVFHSRHSCDSRHSRALLLSNTVIYFHEFRRKDHRTFSTQTSAMGRWFLQRDIPLDREHSSGRTAGEVSGGALSLDRDLLHADAGDDFSHAPAYG